MKLYVMQHGQACSKEQNPQRPLTERGSADVVAMGTILQRAGVSCNRVIHSGKYRAQQTAELVVQALALDVPLESSDIINPNDDPQAFAWQSDSWDQDTMVVGHLPFLAKLVSHLLLGNETACFAEFTPGTIVCLEKRQTQGWQLDWMIRPDLLSQGNWAASQIP